MNKKGLSILLALSMVFSLNTMAFAEEAVVTDEAVVEAVAEDDVEVTQSQDAGKWKVSVNDAQALTSFKDGSVTISGTDLILCSIRYETPGSATVAAVNTGTPGVVCYNGKKVTATDLRLFIRDTKTNYQVPVKAIKTSAKKDATGQFSFTLKSIGAAKDVSLGDRGSITKKEAKDAIKSLSTSFKSAKGTTFTGYIAPSFIRDSISESALKTLKKASKTLSDDAIDDLLADWKLGTQENFAAVYIKNKNSTVKKVQLVYFERKYAKSKLRDTGDGTGYVYDIKVKTRTLKKGKDYVIDGDGIKFDSLDTYTANGTIKAKT